MAERNAVAKKNVSLENGTLTFTFNTQPEPTVITLDANTLSDAIKYHAMLHGLAQKLGDSYAGAKGDVSSAVASFNSVLSALASGEWGRERGEAETGPTMFEQALYDLAVAAGRDITIEQVRETVAKMDDAKKRAIRTRKDVAARIAEIQAERARAKAESAQTDTESILDVF